MLAEDLGSRHATSAGYSNIFIFRSATTDGPLFDICVAQHRVFFVSVPVCACTDIPGAAAAIPKFLGSPLTVFRICHLHDRICSQG